MSREIPTSEPDVFVEGMTWEWDVCFGDFPASAGWQLTYYFRGKVSTGEDITAAWATEVTANGDTFEVRIPFGSTTGLTPGAWQLIGEVTDGTKKHLVHDEPINILTDPATAGAIGFNKTQLDAIEARIAGQILTAEQRRVRINGREIEYASSSELESARAHYKLLYEIERNPTARVVHEARFVG